MSKIGTDPPRPFPGKSEEACSPDELVRAFNELRDELVSTLWFVLGNRDDAQDAAQDAFLKCWRAREDLGKIQNLRAWIFRVAINTARDLRRSAWRRRSKPFQGDDGMIEGKDSAPGEAVEHAEAMEKLRLAIVTLREEEKEVFLLRQNGDLTYEQIAEIRQTPVGTVKTQMRTALQKLRRQLV